MELFNRNTDSPMGRLDVRMKMAMGFSMSVIVVLVDSLFMLGVAAAAGCLFFLLSKPNMSQIRLVAISSVLLVWGIIFSQSLFYNRFPRYAIVVLLEPNWFFREGLKIYAQGIYHGMVQSLRIVATGLTGYAICFSTEPDRFMIGLLAIRIPFSVSFMAVSAIRFLPVVAEEFQAVRTAMRLKGYRPFHRGVRDTVMVAISGLRPILAGTIRRSQEVALSIQTRGFSFNGKRTSLYEERFHAGHWCALIGIVLIVCAAIISKSLFWLYQQELFYAPSLRPLYAFVRDWM